MKDIRELQTQVSEWANHNFPNDTPETVVLGVTEEAGELARASLKRFQRIRGTQEEWLYEIMKECGDVFLKLCHVADVYEFDLAMVIAARWHQIKARDLIADPQGHGLPESG